MSVILWLIAVEVIGLAAFPLAASLFPRLRDFGFTLSKTLGILLIGYATWMLSVLRIVPAGQVAGAVLLVVLGAVSAKLFWDRRDRFRTMWIRERRAIIAGEVLFLVVFGAWLLYRAYDPAIDHTEQPMDFMYLNAVARADVGIPEDPWLRGEAVSYYYFGYWMMGALTRLVGIPTGVSFNLALALIPALAASGIFGLVYNLVRADSRRIELGIVAGVAAAVLLVGAANLEGVLEFGRANGIASQEFYQSTGIQGLEKPAPALTQSWKPDEFWWWWRASRVIGDSDEFGTYDYTIQEFPFFSFMLGDLHPHVMSIPFVLLFLAACWNYLRAPPKPWSSPNVEYGVSLVALGLIRGPVGFTNMWDLPVLAAAFLATAVLRAYRHVDRRGRAIAIAVADWLAVVFVAVLAILPYLLDFSTQATGVAPVVASTSRPLHLFIVWGLFMVAVTPFVVREFWRTTLDEDWQRYVWPSMAVAFGPFVVWTFLQGGHGGTSADIVARLIHVAPLALLLGMAVYSALWLVARGGAPAGKVFALGLSALGLLLVMGPELLYLNDSFGGASERMNTVFKLYYQAWIVLAVASGYAIYYWSSSRPSLRGGARLASGAWAVVFVALLAGSAYYPPAAAASKARLFEGEATLDGLAYIGVGGSEYGAIEFLREEVGDDSAILEAVGGDYSSHGRISGSTGIPTVLGWPGHEVQWRGSGDLLEGREEDVRRVYQDSDAEVAKNLLEKYAVDYVYVGQREREKYGVEGLAKFESFMDVVYSGAGVEIYRLRP